MGLRKVIIWLSLTFWPLSLFLANTFDDFIVYAVPVALLVLGLVFFRKKKRFYLFPLLLIPFVEPKLALLPPVALLFDSLWRKFGKRSFAFLALSLTVLIILWRPFFGQTIFIRDYEARQEVIRNTFLYDSVILARLFHNKGRIVVDKFSDRFFALTDPNNYFFGFAPRQIVDNQNLDKFPAFSIFLVLFGLLRLEKAKDKRFIINLAVASLISLSVLTNFDRNDFILWVPLGLLFIHGTNQFAKTYSKKSMNFFIVFLVFSLVEFIRIFIRHAQ